jgi:hypothetical protein
MRVASWNLMGRSGRAAASLPGAAHWCGVGITLQPLEGWQRD